MDRLEDDVMVAWCVKKSVASRVIVMFVAESTTSEIGKQSGSCGEPRAKAVNAFRVSCVAKNNCPVIGRLNFTS